MKSQQSAGFMTDHPRALFAPTRTGLLALFIICITGRPCLASDGEIHNDAVVFVGPADGSFSKGGTGMIVGTQRRIRTRDRFAIVLTAAHTATTAAGIEDLSSKQSQNGGAQRRLSKPGDLNNDYYVTVHFRGGSRQTVMLEASLVNHSWGVAILRVDETKLPGRRAHPLLWGDPPRAESRVQIVGFDTVNRKSWYPDKEAILTDDVGASVRFSTDVVTQGFSGGPVLDAKGRLIGMVTHVDHKHGTGRGIGAKLLRLSMIDLLGEPDPPCGRWAWKCIVPYAAAGGLGVAAYAQNRGAQDTRKALEAIPLQDRESERAFALADKGKRQDRNCIGFTVAAAVIGSYTTFVWQPWESVELTFRPSFTPPRSQAGGGVQARVGIRF